MPGLTAYSSALLEDLGDRWVHLYQEVALGFNRLASLIHDSFHPFTEGLSD